MIVLPFWAVAIDFGAELEFSWVDFFVKFYRVFKNVGKFFYLLLPVNLIFPVLGKLNTNLVEKSFFFLRMKVLNSFIFIAENRFRVNGRWEIYNIPDFSQ